MQQMQTYQQAAQSERKKREHGRARMELNSSTFKRILEEHNLATFGGNCKSENEENKNDNSHLSSSTGAPAFPTTEGEEEHHHNKRNNQSAGLSKNVGMEGKTTNIAVHTTGVSGISEDAIEQSILQNKSAKVLDGIVSISIEEQQKQQHEQQQQQQEITPTNNNN
mmetsp:Transcript_11393/g.17604  ORF Transcript_11393/g.17604 Transcript_11393/m.17604 type:complete len:166 (-) Transcript_11393:157-654(-)